jgi:hypothetical protein
VIRLVFKKLKIDFDFFGILTTEQFDIICSMTEHTGEAEVVVAEALAKAEDVVMAENVSKVDKLTDLINCPICHEIYVKPMVGSCGHSICAVCYDTKQPTDCPICRQKYITYVENYSLKDIVEKSVDSKEYQARLAEFELLSNVNKNVERVGSLLGKECSITCNKYDPKITILILKKIYDVCSQKDVSTPTNLRTVLYDTFKNTDAFVVLYETGSFHLRNNIIKYYLRIKLGTLSLIVCSNTQTFFP